MQNPEEQQVEINIGKTKQIVYFCSLLDRKKGQKLSDLKLKFLNKNKWIKIDEKNSTINK